MTMKVTAHDMMRHDLQHAPSTHQETQLGAVEFKDGTRKGFDEVKE